MCSESTTIWDKSLRKFDLWALRDRQIKKVNMIILIQDKHLDTWAFEIWQSWKFHLSHDLWPQGRVRCQGHNGDYWSWLQDKQFDTLIFDFGQSWKFDLLCDLWPLRKCQMMRSQWWLLITASRPTIWHLNLWNWIKLRNWPFSWPLTPKEGSDVGVTMITFDRRFKMNNMTP